MKKYKLSNWELKALEIQERVSAVDVARKLRFPARSNVLDHFDLTLTPYLEAPISLIGDSRVEMIGVLASTQSGKTVFLQTAVADAIDQDPGPLLYIMPDENTASRGMDEKIVSIINSSPFLARHKTKYVKDLNASQATLDNMTIHTGWAGSVVSMNSLPMKRVIWDEIRLMPLTTGNESNAIKLGQDRLTTYLDMGLGQGYMASSPSIEGDLLNQQLDIKGTQVLEWQVPCPHCGEFQKLEFFENIVYVKEKERAVCQCKYCHGEFPDLDKKRSWNNKGKYALQGTKIFRDGSLEEPYDLSKRMFFWWDSLVSPFRDFQRIWNEYIITRNKPHDYRNFIQCWLAKFWIQDISKTSINGLEEQKAPYQKKYVPDGVKVILAGGDTQDDGFYIAVWGFGDKRRCWLIDEFFIPCPINVDTSLSIADKLQNAVLSQIYRGSNGEPWKVFLFALDSGGHRTKELYDAFNKLPRSVLVKGNNVQSKSIIFSKTESHYNVRTYEYLDETEQRCISKEFWLPTNVSPDFLMQFVNIRKRETTNKRTGEKKVEWVKKGQCDYRMASIHAFICLDIPLDLGELRMQVESNRSSFNPVQTFKKEEVRKAFVPEEREEEYAIQPFNW